MKRATRADRFFASKLGAAISIDWSGWRVGRARHLAAAVKNIIGRDMNEWDTKVSAGLGHCCRGIGINGICQTLLIFRKVNGCIGGSIDDCAGLCGENCFGADVRV